jgi:hypothetical protein
MFEKFALVLYGLDHADPPRGQPNHANAHRFSKRVHLMYQPGHLQGTTVSTRLDLFGPCDLKKPHVTIRMSMFDLPETKFFQCHYLTNFDPVHPLEDDFGTARHFKSGNHFAIYPPSSSVMQFVIL